MDLVAPLTAKASIVMQIIPNSSELNVYYSAGCFCKDFKLCGIFVPAKCTVNLG